ncbi:MAG TPA: protein-glutamate O-methyltransferase CheR, partial [Kofleriaceae bacterium]|nr:protein-glutamate O-methyltransferase CheR [Kofleriaceae bacterium]
VRRCRRQGGAVSGHVLTPQLFALFSGLIEDACGLHYSPRDHELLASKLLAHTADSGYDSLLDYYYRLRYDDAGGHTLTALVEALVVHETYFFRELPPLLYLVEHHLPAIIAKRGRARVWSAACATGEEPFTLAMLLDARGLLDRVEIVATDISAAAIRNARSGRHTRRSIRDGCPRELVERYLHSDGSGVTLDPRIRDAVAFSTLNLFGDTSQIATCDLILCRNVLIYFRDEQIGRLIQRLISHLAPDGLLAVGVSESLLRFGTSLACEERGGAFFYRVRS